MLNVKKAKRIIGVVAMVAFLAATIGAPALSAMASEKKEKNNSHNTSKQETSANHADDDDDDDDEDSASEVITANDMLHFKLKVRWGNVEDDPVSVAETNFKGSISVDNSARISLEDTLKFENHNASADKITEETDAKISWNSLIYSDWDGVMVDVSAPASSYVTIDTSLSSASSGYATSGATTYRIKKTAQELYSSNEEIAQDVGSGREVVAKSYKSFKNPRYFLKVYWGKIERDGYSDECNPGQARTGKCDNPLLNANGTFKIGGGGKLQLMKKLRFEAGDKITSSNDAEIGWNSTIYGGLDGILVNLKLDSGTLDASDTVTINFTSINKKFSHSIIDLYHDGLTKDVIDGNYGVAFEVWKRPNKSVIKVRNKPTVYVIEDGLKMPIQSPIVLASNGLSFDDVEEVDQEEADTYADAEPLNYADGTMVREADRFEVYVIANGQKKHILDPISFADLGYNWNNVIVVAPKSLGIFTSAAPMNSNSAHPEGALIRVESAPTVYVVEGGKRIPISDIQLFNARKYDWNKVLVVKEKQAKKFDVTTQLTYPDGSLIREKTGKVYVVDHGKKRWVRSSEDFKKAGFKEGKIVNVDSTAAGQLPEGDDIVADDIE